MARILAVALGCISLLYLHLPGVLARSLSRRPRPGRPRELPARTPSSGLKPQYLAPQPAAWKLGRAPQPQRSARPARAMGQPLQDRNRQHSGPHRLSSPRRPQAQLLRLPELYRLQYFKQGCRPRGALPPTPGPAATLPTHECGFRRVNPCPPLLEHTPRNSWTEQSDAERTLGWGGGSAQEPSGLGKWSTSQGADHPAPPWVGRGLWEGPLRPLRN
ncbi:protein ADM2 isoform X1 [Tamandua tetradactyla]|uniref:protein ADM2 isoform X1 n=1 Tax=Tamandua tetradactyla TaxID=48850 RepID=UPI004053ABBE